MVVLLFGIIAITLIVIFTPKYKITWMGPENFIKTEQTSSLYKRSAGKECYHWDKISIYSGIVALACCLAIFTSRDKRG